MSRPSPFVLRHLPALGRAARSGAVVDLACGRGRHALALARAGVPAIGLDRSPEHLGELRTTARGEGLPVSTVRADLETGLRPPLAPGRCGALVVCRYLHRPLAPWLEACLAPGGWLLYETFTIHQRNLGYGPSNAAFLLEPGELPTLFPGLAIAEHWEGLCEAGERPAELARLAARRPF